jgi:hypothetical protein
MVESIVRCSRIWTRAISRAVARPH